MLQPMSSLSHVGEDSTLARIVEGRLQGDASSEASSDATEDFELPQCKIRRNYNCSKCNYFTQNPRAYLVHSRDIHFEKFKIYDCPQCVYASRHHQKLLRHLKMVHSQTNSNRTVKSDLETLTVANEPTDEAVRMEDLLEEVEESVEMDSEMDVQDCSEESLERAVELETEPARPTSETTSTNDSKNKTKFFSCNKCNYVTHLRARYTKHVKYHSMPMIKCTLCDFRTPYKWNLDRHMKNHGGGGNFCCSMCNFTADIKQSLTVHEMNHHTPPVGQSTVSRRRNRVGASDIAVEPAVTLGARDDEGSDSRSSPSLSVPEHSAPYSDCIEMISIGSDYKEMVENNTKTENISKTGSLSKSAETKTFKENRKKARPIPQLIPLNGSTPNKSPNSEPPIKKFKESLDDDHDAQFETTMRHNILPADVTLLPVKPMLANKENPPRKKNESFFDKLKERILTETGEEGSLICKNCGFESKCLSEHSVHEKTCNSQANRVMSNASVTSLGSTRCQNCRHRCKSSADLYNHMKTCSMATTNSTEKDGSKVENSTEHNAGSLEREAEPHPMENVVFVWNNISLDTNKFENPLDININDDSTLPQGASVYDPNNVDALHDNEGMSLSPTQSAGKKVFKCPHCPFWASTASRFHVHIVGHLNKKPFECSLCQYKSNWRWDITKHIKLKSARDPEHNSAEVLMTDETGRRNYSKYNKFLALLSLNERGENEFNYIDENAAGIDSSIDVDDSINEIGPCHENDHNTSTGMQPLNLQTHQSDLEDPNKKPKKTLWKCKKCNYRNPSKEALLDHVREHSKVNDFNQEEGKSLNLAKKNDLSGKDPADLAYRCGHCNQLSNWKHVIQRHCRLKHDGIIKVIATEKPKLESGQMATNELNNDFCTKCPFKTNDKKLLLAHLQQHTPSPQSIFKCYFCPYFVKTEHDLLQHLVLHGITDPEDYVSKAMGCKEPIAEQSTSSLSPATKRHKCTECPYETNSKSQFMYHEQFHRLPADTPYKCQECNYSVSKRHLLHQHMRVHGIIVQKKENEPDMEQLSMSSDKSEGMKADTSLFEDIPYVWVSAKNEFHKMYKCRYCSYVNSQKCKIPNHEKIHCILFENNETVIYKCLECKFTCNKAWRLSEHSKTHGEIYGRIYCSVESEIPDDEQIAGLRLLLEEEKKQALESLQASKEESLLKANEDDKLLYFCQICPVRFFLENELKAHIKFHDSSYSYKCKSCEFSVPQENLLTSHNFVHSDEYQTKTKMLKIIHEIHPDFKEPKLELVHSPATSEIIWIVPACYRNANRNSLNKNNDSKHTPKHFNCKLCPAKFFKNSALTYHMGLHGGDGQHKCKKCNYRVKNVGNLAKHEALHDEDNKNGTNCDYESGEDLDFKNVPLSGTDLFQRKTEAQKRVHTDKDRLVKPNDHFPPVLQADPQFGYLMHGNPEFIYPTYLKNGRQKEKRYKCHKCPSAFEKREQYKIHLSLHGSKQRYKCELCDYSVKYYANYVQHMRKHQMNAEAQAERKKSASDTEEVENQCVADDNNDTIKLAIKSMPKATPRSDFQQFSVSDQQTLRLLQRRRSINAAVKEQSPTETSPVKDRKLHLCVFCPYSNQRQDALANHYKRHDNSDIHNLGNHKCTHCDLTVVQSHFLREHLKTHFNFPKALNPQCYAANENVTFKMTKLEEENDVIDIVLFKDYKISNSNVNIKIDKILVQTSTGEIVTNQ